MPLGRLVETAPSKTSQGNICKDKLGPEFSGRLTRLDSACFRAISRIKGV